MFVSTTRTASKSFPRTFYKRPTSSTSSSSSSYHYARPFACSLCCRTHQLRTIRAKSSDSSSASSAAGGTTNNNTPATAQDLQALHQELRALQSMIQQSRSQTYHVESLTRNVAARTADLESTLLDIKQSVSRITVVEKIVTSVQDFLQNHPAVQGLLRNFENILHRSTPFIQHYKYGIYAAAVIAAIIWKYRSSLVYERTSEEIADLTRLTLEQESLRASIQETLRTLANNPSTLRTLNELVQKLITDKHTEQDVVNLLVHAIQTPEVQNALLELLQVVFQDPHLQKLTGEFLLKGLDMENVKQMLDEQTAELVRDTVSDDSVQQATAVGLQRSVWYAVTPSFLWRFMEQNNKDKKKESSNDSKDSGEGHKVRNISVPRAEGEEDDAGSNDDDKKEESDSKNDSGSSQSQ